MAAEVGEDREAEVAEGDEDADRPAHAGHIPGLFTWHTLRLEREGGRFSACLPASVKMHVSGHFFGIEKIPKKCSPRD